MPKAEGESRVSWFSGDIYAAAADAMNGGKLVVDRSVILDAGRPLILKNILAEGRGRGDSMPSITGPVEVRGDWGFIRDVWIKKASTIGLKFTGYNVGGENIRISDCAQSMMITDHTFYGHFSLITANIGIQKGLSFNTPPGSVDDNGQFQFNACKFDGGQFAIKRDLGAATMHRIQLNQTQLSGGYSGDYIADLLGIGELTMNTCDIEVSGVGPKLAMVRLGAFGQYLLNCPMSFPVNAGAVIRTKKGIVTTGDYGLKAKVDHCGFTYAPAGSTMITTAPGLSCHDNYFAGGKGAGAMLYDAGMKGWIQGEDVGLWVGGVKRF
jgi:hypothetical protein